MIISVTDPDTGLALIDGSISETNILRNIGQLPEVVIHIWQEPDLTVEHTTGMYGYFHDLVRWFIRRTDHGWYSVESVPVEVRVQVDEPIPF